MANQLLTQMIQIFTQVATSIIGVALIAAFAIIFLSRLLKTKSKRPTLTPLKELTVTRRQPLTDHEKKMYFALTTALPEYIVLAQVAFSALITTQSQETRNRFDRKVADFVLCSQSLNVIAIIELDDASHKGRERNDADRDDMLANAKYTTIRYPKIPTTETIRADIEQLLTVTSQARQ